MPFFKVYNWCPFSFAHYFHLPFYPGPFFPRTLFSGVNFSGHHGEYDNERFLNVTSNWGFLFFLNSIHNMSYYMEVSSCPTLPLSWVSNCPVSKCPVSKCPVSSCPGFVFMLCVILYVYVYVMYTWTHMCVCVECVYIYHVCVCICGCIMCYLPWCVTETTAPGIRNTNAWTRTPPVAAILSTPPPPHPPPQPPSHTHAPYVSTPWSQACPPFHVYSSTFLSGGMGYGARGWPRQTARPRPVPCLLGAVSLLPVIRLVN